MSGARGWPQGRGPPTTPRPRSETIDREKPPRIRWFINSVIATPLENIEVPLTSFVWDFDDGDFHHWVDLFNHFDSYFEKFIKPRKDLQLVDEFMDCDPPFPRKGVIQVLRVIRIILEYCTCTDKHLYSSYEQHFASLLASNDADVVEACLQTLLTFMKKPIWNYHILNASFSLHLYSFAQGWGAKEEGLGLVACAAPQVSDPAAYALGCTLHFEFNMSESPRGHTGETESSQDLHVIHVPHVNECQETDLELLNKLVKKHEVPCCSKFSLWTRVRFARAFGSWPTREQYTRIRLYAVAVLAQAISYADLMVPLFNNEPELESDLVTLLSSEDAVPGDIRIVCVLSLVALCQDRSRMKSVLTSVTSGGHSCVLSSLMHRAVISVMSNNPSKGSVVFAEALLSLVYVLVSSSLGCPAMRESGFVPILLPLLKDTDPRHLHFVTTAAHVLGTFMNYFEDLLGDLGGLDETISRLKFEVSYIETSANQREMDHQRKISVLSPFVSLEESTVEPLYSLFNYYRRLLIKALLRAVSVGTYAPGINLRVFSTEDSFLQCLCVIFRRAKEFGGGVFSLAAIVMSDLIHKNLTCYLVLEGAGLPSTFIDAIMDGVLCSAEAITSVPQCLEALCLNNNGLQAVKDRSALRCFVKIFTSKTYMPVLAGDVAGSLSAGLVVLMRHVSELYAPCVDMLIEIFNEIAKMGSVPESLTPPSNSISCMTAVLVETDPEERKVVLSDDWEMSPNRNSDKTVGSLDVSSDILESFLPDLVHNAAQLLAVLHNSELCRIFVDKKGIEAVLQLLRMLLMPLFSPIGQSVSLAFKNFSPQHSASLARVVCTFFKDHLQSTNELMMSVGGTSLAKLEESMQATVLRSLYSLECFLCLLNSLLEGKSNVAVASEVGAADSEILMEIGKTYREVLWQLSICYDLEWDEMKLRSHDDVLVLECLTKLLSAMRAFLISLVRGFVVPNHLSSSKSIGAAISKIFYEGLNFQTHANETSISLKCRYLGKVVDDLTALTVDARTRTCYAAMVNYFYVQGTFRELLTTFAATCNLLWTPFSIPDGVDRVMSNKEGMLSHSSWLLDTLQSYCNSLDNFVNCPPLLSPSSSLHDQLLVQPAASSLSNELIPVPREPAAFVKMLKLQVLDILLPVWNHPMFGNCSEGFIASVTSLMTRVDSNFGGVKPNRSGIASTNRRLVVPPPSEATVNTIVEVKRQDRSFMQILNNTISLYYADCCSLVPTRSKLKVALFTLFALSLLQPAGEKKKLPLPMSLKGETVHSNAPMKDRYRYAVDWDRAAKVLAEHCKGFGICSVLAVVFIVCFCYGLIYVCLACKRARDLRFKQQLQIDNSNVIGVSRYGTIVERKVGIVGLIAVKRMLKKLFDYDIISNNFKDYIGVLNFCPTIATILKIEVDQDYIMISSELGLKNLAQMVDDYSPNGQQDNMGLEGFVLWRSAERHHPSDHLIYLMRDVFQGLSSLHERRKAHRRLCPNNILIMRRNGRFCAKLSDIGMDRSIIKSSLRSKIPLDFSLSEGWRLDGIIECSEIAADIFSLGCILYYCLAGTHPYGSMLERTYNIINASLQHNPNVIEVSEAMDLLPKMLDTETVMTSDYIKIEEVCSHPLFWTWQEKLEFIAICTDHAKDSHMQTIVMPILESRADEIFSGKNWKNVLDKKFWNLPQRRFYNRRKVEDLLRFIRNHYRHFSELHQTLKVVLESASRSYTYFEDRFPNLFMITYETVKENCSNEAWLIDAYPNYRLWQF